MKAEQAGLFVVYSDIRSESADAYSNRNLRKKVVFYMISHIIVTKLLILETIIATIKMFRVSLD